jgi:flagellar biosynthesis/type III secretory pathway M-ring protein FliF/YscJ
VTDINDPVWSVIILLCCGLAFTLYCVIYILRLSFKELEEDVQESEQGQEGDCEQQEAEPGQCNSEEG